MRAFLSCSPSITNSGASSMIRLINIWATIIRCSIQTRKIKNYVKSHTVTELTFRFPSSALYTKSVLKVELVKYISPQLVMIESLVRISKQSMNEPIPLETSALNLLTYVKFFKLPPIKM